MNNQHQEGGSDGSEREMGKLRSDGRGGSDRGGRGVLEEVWPSPRGLLCKDIAGSYLPPVREKELEKRNDRPVMLLQGTNEHRPTAG